MVRRLTRGVTALAVAILTFVGVGLGPAGASPAPAKAGPTGSITVVELNGFYGSWTGFDPPVATSASTFEPSVLGSLFDVGPNYKLIPDLATSAKLSKDGLTLTIKLRPGVKFSNGDPFNSSVVAFNMKRDIDPKLPNGGTTANGWPMKSVDTPNPTTVVVHFTKVFAPVISELNQTDLGLEVDPIALKKMGETAYNLKPVGAGPYEVVSDKLGVSLVVKANPNYWNKSLPHIEQITVQSVASEETGVEALEAGQAQVMEQLRTIQLVDQQKKAGKFNVTATAGETPYIVQLNTRTAPFNNLKAREAIYYATNPQQIDEKLFGNAFPLTQSPTGPGGLFYEPKVPGYRTFNLAKAKALVQQLGGLNFQLGDTNLLSNNETMEALASEWKEAGITTTQTEYILPNLIQQYMSDKWNALVQIAGGYDPAVGVGLNFRLLSTSLFSGVHDPKLDAMLNGATGVLNPKKRAAEYHAVFKYVSDNAYMPALFNGATYDMSTKNMVDAGPPAGTGGDGFSDINWATVSMS